MYHAKRGGEHFRAWNEAVKLGNISQEQAKRIKNGQLLGNKNR